MSGGTGRASVTGAADSKGRASGVDSEVATAVGGMSASAVEGMMTVVGATVVGGIGTSGGGIATVAGGPSSGARAGQGTQGEGSH